MWILNCRAITKKNHCIDVSLSIYTHTVHDTKDVNIQVEAGMTLGCKNDGGRVTSSPIPSGRVRRCSGPILDEGRQIFFKLLQVSLSCPRAVLVRWMHQRCFQSDESRSRFRECDDYRNQGRPLDATFTTRPSALPYLWYPMLPFLIYIKHFPI